MARRKANTDGVPVENFFGFLPAAYLGRYRVYPRRHGARFRGNSGRNRLQAWKIAFYSQTILTLIAIYLFHILDLPLTVEDLFQIIEMTACRLLREGPRAHFMTRRFDRDDSGKIHMQSLCAMAHYDFNATGQYGYEQALQVIQQLRLGYPAMEELFRRMVFNVLARNQDDHTRNIAFLMDRQGRWRLSPAFDVVWAYNPSGKYSHQHQMSINGKRDDFSRKDLLAVADQFGIRNAGVIMEQVAKAVAAWAGLAAEQEVPKELRAAVQKSLRLGMVTKK